ncbi:RepA protein [Companilactobacillus paralimentarius DSM 13238 = JCM 10415]|uniref:RepA protein n=2 Tax=Companilactobacillus paralimentarius TaxID=83526 RepID=A0A0R1PS07_9LACO|nr:phage/plasmid primase, P4 family [Companilactobacillus paralimentarius]KAE9564524.1 hypothetical protein ATN96_08165 [Companilactobacillus paralimentarius]KAE9564944.1 hypothetical protein ATN96_06035 [Companilactobacillus paralimentarius]KRL31224.1 RepA protein [Companilactobacillus paralimentarius DSM 13238 = JCM 10415]QFR70113.1 hypothetical protein LP238_10440 [Companilactobacillus paralimentarius]
MKELPKEIKETIDNSKTEIVTSPPELVPYDISFTPYPSEEVASDPDTLRAYNEQANERTPKWLDLWFVYKKPTRNKLGGSITLNHDVDDVTYGDAFLRTNIMKRSKGMMEGFNYLPNKGIWNIYGKGESQATIESILTRDLRAWGVYENNTVNRVRLYILRMMFDRSLGNKSPFDTARPELVAFKNGTYNILTDELQPHNPNNYLLTYHNYNINPDINECPATDHLMKKMFGDASITLKEYIGYMFYHSYSKFNKAVFLHGTGGNGKSTFINHVLKNVIGDDNNSAIPPDQMGGKQNRFNTAELFRKEVNMVADIDDEYIENTAILKNLTGGDSINAEFKGITGFHFRNYAKLLFSANSLPKFKDDTDGFASRLITIDTISPNTRNEPNGHPEWWNDIDMNKIKKEAPIFAVNCMQLFSKVIKRNAFTIPRSVQISTNKWKDDNDKFKQFISDCFEFTNDDTNGEKAVYIHDAWVKYARGNGYSDKMSISTIANKLEKYGIYKKKSRNGNGISDTANPVSRFMGIRVITDNGYD